ncbi:MAG: HAD family phosphatase [Nitrospirota bacterium]
MIKAILFDFGGVIAAEGFYEGVRAIGSMQRLDPNAFFLQVEKLIGETGYLTGTASEDTFWNAVRSATGISLNNEHMREEIIKRFVIRPEMIAAVDALKSQGMLVVLLSDQTNWLDEINEDTQIFRHFDAVFNSYHIHKSKRDPSLFREICAILNVMSHETVLIDDNPGHIQRARDEGLEVIQFTTIQDFQHRMKEIDFAVTVREN